MAVQYAPLFALETQFQAKNGRNLTGGFLRVFYAATDDPADTYSDYNLTRNPDRIVLDDNGRALVICDKSKAYRLEVYDAEGMLLWTEEPVYCSGTGGGGVSITKVISTDGSISIDESVAGSTTTYDIGLAPRDNDEFLEWIKCSEEDCGSTWYPVYQEGTMETEAGQGIKVHKGQLYHFTNTFYVDPDGTGINYDTFKVNMYCGDTIVDSRDFDIDSSLNDAVQCEFSTDVIPEEDSHVYFKLTIPATCEVTSEVQCHRIYSGINAVPDTCATKQWVSANYEPQSAMSAYVPFSGLDYNPSNQITGISGSAIAGSLDSATVSAIASSVASSYTESAFSSISSWTAEFSSISSKADSSSLSAYQPVSAMSGYATEAYVDAKVGDKLDATASSLFLTGLPDDLATTGDVASAVSGKLDKSASGEFYPMTGNPSGFLTAHQSLAGLATVEYVDSSVSSKLDTSAFASASAGFAPTGDYAFNSSLSAYYPASASGAFQPSGNYQTAGDYAFNSAVSSKLDASASSSFVVNSSMSSWIPYSALDYSGTAISGIDGSSLAGMGGGDYTGIYPVNVDNTAREISVDSLPLVTDSSMTAYGSAGSSVIGVNLDIMSGKQDTLSFSYDDDKISAINGSALAGQGGGEQVVTSLQYATSESGAIVGSTTGDKVGYSNKVFSANYYQGQGWFNYQSATALAAVRFTSWDSNITGQIAYPFEIFMVPYGATNNGNIEYITSVGSHMGDYGQFYDTSDFRIATGMAMMSGYSAILDFRVTSLPFNTNYGQAMWGHDGGDILGDNEDSEPVFSIVYGSGSYNEGRCAPITDGPKALDFGAITTVSSVSGINNLGIMGIGGAGGIDSATCSAIASAYAESAASSKLDTTAQVVSATGTQLYAGTTYVTSVNEAPISADRAGRAGNATLATSAYYDTNARFISALPDSAAVSAIASAYAESAASSKQDTLAFAYNTADQISSINGSALGGMDEAAVSGIASAYAESAASSKLDASASSSFYSTANESGFITGVDLSPYQTTADMSGYIPTSMSSDFQQVTGMSSYALSADVSATVDLVGTQSANWGGSALALSAGPGVRLEKVGNTLVAGLDETVLWSGNPEKTTTTAKTYSLSEDLRNFARYRVVVNPHEQSVGAIQRPCQEFTLNLEYNPTSTPIYAQFPAYTIGGNILTINYWYLTGAEGTCTSLGLLAGVRQTNATVTTGITAYSGSIVKIVGINRTAGI